MGKLVFNYKKCEHSPSCGAKLECEKIKKRKLGLEKVPEGKKAIYWDNKAKRIKLNRDNCDECKERGCKVCECFFVTQNEYDFVEEIYRIQMMELDKSYMNKERFGAQIANKTYLLTDIYEAKRLIKIFKGLIILEVTNNGFLTSHFDSIDIEYLLGEYFYNGHYHKLLIEPKTVDEFYKVFLPCELPALLFIRNGKLLKHISGIYKNFEVDRKIDLKHTIVKILLDGEGGR